MHKINTILAKTIKLLCVKCLNRTKKLKYYPLIVRFCCFSPISPIFPFCFDYYFIEFVPRLLLEFDIALIFSSSKQFLDNST